MNSRRGYPSVLFFAVLQRPRRGAGRAAILALAAAMLPAFSARADILHAHSEKPLAGTTGVTPRPGIDLSDWDTTGHTLNSANFVHVDLSGALFTDSDLRHALFTKADLSSADFTGAMLKGANFSGATTAGADFSSASGFTYGQIHATADFAHHDLQGITFDGDALQSAGFRGQNLTGSAFVGTRLGHADFRSANLTGVNFQNATLSHATLAHAIIAGADFQGTTGFTKAELYSTASYARKTLGAINLYDLTMNGWNFSGQNMTRAAMGGVSAINGNFAGADLSSASFYNALTIGGGGGPIYITPITVGGEQPDEEGSDLTGANFTGANLAGRFFAIRDTDRREFHRGQHHGR